MSFSRKSHPNLYINRERQGELWALWVVGGFLNATNTENWHSFIQIRSIEIVGGVSSEEIALKKFYLTPEMSTCRLRHDFSLNHHAAHAPRPIKDRMIEAYNYGALYY